MWMSGLRRAGAPATTPAAQRGVQHRVRPGARRAGARSWRWRWRASWPASPTSPSGLYPCAPRTDAAYLAPAAFGLARLRDAARRRRRRAGRARPRGATSAGPTARPGAGGPSCWSRSGGGLPTTSPTAIDSVDRRRPSIPATALRLRVDVLDAALRRRRRRRPGARPCASAGSPAEEPALRDGARAAYRELAALTDDRDERIAPGRRGQRGPAADADVSGAMRGRERDTTDARRRARRAASRWRRRRCSASRCGADAAPTPVPPPAATEPVGRRRRSTDAGGRRRGGTGAVRRRAAATIDADGFCEHVRARRPSDERDHWTERPAAVGRRRCATRASATHRNEDAMALAADAEPAASPSSSSATASPPRPTATSRQPRPRHVRPATCSPAPADPSAARRRDVVRHWTRSQLRPRPRRPDGRPRSPSRPALGDPRRTRRRARSSPPSSTGPTWSPGWCGDSRAYWLPDDGAAGPAHASTTRGHASMIAARHAPGRGRGRPAGAHDHPLARRRQPRCRPAA